MTKSLLIIINGAPCTGKTTLGRKLAKQLCLPFLSKDGIKEVLFDTLGWEDREFRVGLIHASWALLHFFLKTQVEAGRSLIVDTAFIPKFDTPKLLELKKRHDFEPFQILCKTDAGVLFKRFKARSESGERHPGHTDHLVTSDQFDEFLINEKYKALDIGGSIFEIDTTDFKSIDYGGLLAAINLKISLND